MKGNTVEMAALLDAFGALLTNKQREYCEMYYYEDLSLAEIAENVGVSVPGVHDTVIRGVAKMREAEHRLGVVARRDKLLERVDKAAVIAARLREAHPADADSAELCACLNDVSDGV
ncbi:MAG: DNA-binding protein [Oscillospiraceae bacterium]|nr:DNA-binding protein [Oscillospiraceae bacterium]